MRVADNVLEITAENKKGETTYISAIAVTLLVQVN